MRKPAQLPELATSRLLLRSLKSEDAPQIFELRSNESVNRYVDRPRAKSVDDAHAFIEKIGWVLENHEGLYWAIVVNDEASIAGTVALWNLDDSINKAEIGFELLPTHQGKGIMKDALKAVLSFGFSELQVSVIEAWTHPDNITSRKLLESLGFRRDLEAEQQKQEASIEIIYSLQAKDHSYT